jgi:peptide deformylase
MQLQIANKPPVTPRPYKINLWTRIKNIKSKEVDVIDASLKSFEEMAWRLVETCLHDDGIGLAAPQVGIFKRVMVCRELDKDIVPLPFFQVYINPEFEPVIEDGKGAMKEYCLSVPEQGYDIIRWNTINIRWQEVEDGKLKMVDKVNQLTGYAARIFQHEHDHLNGISIPQRHDFQSHKKKKKTKRKKRK